MSTVKLTNIIRENIVRDLLIHRFSRACDELAKDRAAFAWSVYCDIYDAKTLARMNDLPRGWLPEREAVHPQFGGTSGFEHLPFNGGGSHRIGSLYSAPLPVIKYRVTFDHHKGVMKVYEDATHPLWIEHDKMDARQSELASQIIKAADQATAALASVSTFASLVKNWPEIEPFANNYLDASGSQLPALPTKELNALLDLPVV